MFEVREWTGKEYVRCFSSHDYEECLEYAQKVCGDVFWIILEKNEGPIRKHVLDTFMLLVHHHYEAIKNGDWDLQKRIFDALAVIEELYPEETKGRHNG